MVQPCEQVRRWHVLEPGGDMWLNKKVICGQAGKWHMVQSGGSWHVDTWHSTRSPRVRPLAKCAAGTSPNGIDNEPRHLPAWTGTRGFLRRVTKAKNDSVTKVPSWLGKKQFRDIYGSFVTVEQTWRNFYNELKFVSKSSLSFLCDEFGLYSNETCSLRKLRFPLVLESAAMSSNISTWYLAVAG